VANTINYMASQYTAGMQTSDVIRGLESRIIALEEYIEWDRELREKNPALQDLYEKFQATKRLVIS